MNTYPEEIDILFMSYAQISFKAEIQAESFEINWGDGNISTYRNNLFSVINHDFANEGLQSIRITGINISSLKVSHLSLNAIILSNCPHLEYLDCSVNELSKLDLSHCPALEELHCNSNNIRKLNLTHQSHLQQANLSYNLLESLDITSCTSLQFLYCSENRLSDLNLKSKIPLRCLDISNNLLEWESLAHILQQLSYPTDNRIIHYTQNPGTDFCNYKIHTFQVF